MVHSDHPRSRRSFVPGADRLHWDRGTASPSEGDCRMGLTRRLAIGRPRRRRVSPRRRRPIGSSCGTGRRFKGKAIVDEAHPDQYLVFGEKGKTPLDPQEGPRCHDRARAEPARRVVPPQGLSKALRGRAGRRTSSTSGLWCEEHKLSDLASVHFEGSIKRDPAFGPGHKKLGPHRARRQVAHRRPS